jgi:hypothetical protein
MVRLAARWQSFGGIVPTQPAGAQHISGLSVA